MAPDETYFIQTQFLHRSHRRRPLRHHATCWHLLPELGRGETRRGRGRASSTHADGPDASDGRAKQTPRVGRYRSWLVAQSDHGAGISRQGAPGSRTGSVELSLLPQPYALRPAAGRSRSTLEGWRVVAGLSSEGSAGNP